MKHFLHLASKISYSPGFAGPTLPGLSQSLSWLLLINLMSCIGLSQNSVLRPPLFSIYIHLLGDLIPYHCFKYCLHANSSFCPPFWSTSLNFRLVYTIQYLISLQGCLKLIVFKIEPPIFIHQIHSYDGLSILVHGRFIFPIAQEKTKSIIFSFAYTPHSI